ncbi:hypothetical protein CPBF367_12380 [Xanthomonas arboricola pv. juglandis]|nr:hypothetical protein CPBF367_12380 [Xanthomonas arboricola pv. juglandis]
MSVGVGAHLPPQRALGERAMPTQRADLHDRR